MKKNLSIIFTFQILSFAAIAQVNYSFSTFTSAYQPIQNGISLEVPGWDDEEFVVPIPFTFTFADEELSSLVQVGVGAAFGSEDEDDYAFFGDFSDFHDAGVVDNAPTSTIKYATTGATGNRILKIDYVQSAFYEEVSVEEPSADNLINFQIWLYETNSAIEIRYGANTISDPLLVYDGLPGPIIGIAILTTSANDTILTIKTLTGSPQNPQIAESIIDEDDDEEDLPGLSGVPENGRVYRFVPDGITGIEESHNQNIEIFPSLVSNELRVSGQFMSNSAFRIFDITGEEIHAGRISSQQAINVSFLQSGIYFFTLDELPQAQKFVKQ